MSKRRAQPIIANKEDGNFREALKLYESKQYKKSLKITEQILKKNSNYTDALALKALVLHFLNEPAESELYVTKTLAKDTHSPVANHILGILKRNQLKYGEAARYFKAALDNGSTNKQIWRDLSTMELQERDYKSLAASRLAYLDEFLGYRANWTSLAIANHLNKDYAAAERTLSKFEELVKGKLSEAEMYEHSELALYKNHMIAEQDVERALKDLENLDTLDKLAELELKAKYLMKLGRNKEAQKVYRQLLKRNSDNVHYYELLEEALGTTTKSAKYRDQLYAKLAKLYPRSDPPKFIPLTFTTGDLFRERAKDYINGQLSRGVPATFNNVKPLYQDREKAMIIQDIVEEFYKTAQEVSPLCWVWTTYFLTQHYLHLSDLNKARELIEAAIEHTPTLVELYPMKARVYKHLGDAKQAAEIMNEGRLLDLQDRFINSKTVKYYLRANDMENAVKTVSLFTKNDNAVNGVKDLHTMQASWFVVESAEAYHRLFDEAIRKGDTEEIHKYCGLALKRYQAIVKIFDEYWNDQVDFHTFCMRKGTARAYIEMLNWEDKVYASAVNCRAVEGASKIYFKLDEDKSLIDEESKEEVLKNDKKAKKEKAAKAKALESEKASVAAYADDEDVFGEKLVGDLSKLNDLFFARLFNQGQDKLVTNDIQFELQFRLKKIALAVAALVKLKTISNDQYYKIPGYILKLKYKSEAGLTKMLAEKGIEKNFEVDFDNFEEFMKKYCPLDTFEGVLGLRDVYKQGVLDAEPLKQQIMTAIQDFEPLEQFEILNSL